MAGGGVQDTKMERVDDDNDHAAATQPSLSIDGVLPCLGELSWADHGLLSVLSILVDARPALPAPSGTSRTIHLGG